MLTVYTLQDEKKWDSIVKNFDNYDVYYLPSYVKSFQLHGDGEPNLIYFENEDLKVINVVMKRDISKIHKFGSLIEPNTYFDFSTPYGYGGFLLEGDTSSKNIQILKEEYEKYCLDNNIISEFVRFHPLYNNEQKLDEIYEIVPLGNTISIDLEQPDKIWENLVGKNRNVIRKAKKNGVEIYWGRDHSLLEEFIPLYNQTMNSDDATEYYYFDNDFYDSVLHDLKYNMLFFYAVFEGKITSIAMILFGDDFMHYHLSASDREFQRLASNNLLLYEAAYWGSQNGYKKFHLGGGVGSQEDSLYSFKKRFSKNEPCTYSVGKKIFNMEMYKKLVELHTNIDVTNESFFPLYRQ